MMKLLSESKRIINIDETWINETNFVRKTWGERNGEGNSILNSVSPKLSMITAIDTEGHVWFSLSQANTDSNMIVLFVKSLVNMLDKDEPGWLENTVFLFDNASYHTSKETRTALQVIGARVIYSGPYSYAAAPVELLFGALKNKEINPEKKPTGKR